MAEGYDSEAESWGEEKYHKARIWEDFCRRATEAGNRAIEYLELGDVEGEYSDDELDEIYTARFESPGVIIEAAYNFLWPEIEGLAIKLGVPFLPEIASINKRNND